MCLTVDPTAPDHTLVWAQSLCMQWISVYSKPATGQGESLGSYTHSTVSGYSINTKHIELSIYRNCILSYKVSICGIYRCVCIRHRNFKIKNFSGSSRKETQEQILYAIGIVIFNKIQAKYFRFGYSSLSIGLVSHMEPWHHDD